MNVNPRSLRPTIRTRVARPRTDRPASSATARSFPSFVRRQVVSIALLLLVAALALHTPRLPAARAWPAGSTVIYVDDSATGAGDGSSWADAFTSLQGALEQAESGDEIWVAAGFYVPGASRADTFSLKNGVAIYGGFAGSESSREQRNWLANESVLTGEIGDTARVDNSIHVVTATRVGPGAILDGVTIRHGWGDGGERGGGMLNSEASPTVSNVLFFENYAEEGGGIYNERSSPALNNVTFLSNESGGSGGGIYNEDGSSPALNFGLFAFNKSGGSGGGMYNGDGSNPTLNRVQFGENHAFQVGGGMFNNNGSSPTLVRVSFYLCRAGYGGGGMWNEEASNPTLVNVRFEDNTAENASIGGALGNVDSSPTLFNVRFLDNVSEGPYGGAMSNGGASSPRLYNVAFRNNRAAAQGGAIYNYGQSSVALVNATFTGNGAGEGAGALYSMGMSRVDIRNSILWDNGDGQIGNLVGAETFVEYSLVEGGYAGEGNIDADPLFRNPDGPDGIPGTFDDHLRLRSDSPAVDAGSNDLVPADDADLDGDGDTDEPLPLDLGGAPRFLDVPAKEDMGSGDAPVVDMGAYETSPVLYVRDGWLLGDGSSWANALGSLQTALAYAASGDEIWVAAGSYVPGPSRGDSFVLKDGVAIYGGFAGSESSRDERDWQANQTVLSGEIGDDATREDNTLHVVSAGAGIGPSTLLDGFAIRHGWGGGGAGGAGMYNSEASPTLVNLVFLENHAQGSGGAMHNDRSSPTLVNVAFIENSSDFGGAMYNSAADLTLVNVLFRANQAGSGSAMNNEESTMTLVNATFSGNEAEQGGAIYNPGGNSLTLRNSIVWGNGDEPIVDDGSGSVTVEYSLVEGGYVGEGNVDADPLFQDPEGDLRPRSDSPAVDAGNNSFVPADELDLDADEDTGERLSLDLGGSPRFVDVPAKEDTGRGDGPIVDLGAYEVQADAVTATPQPSTTGTPEPTTTTTPGATSTAPTGTPTASTTPTGSETPTRTATVGAPGDEALYLPLIARLGGVAPVPTATATSAPGSTVTATRTPTPTSGPALTATPSPGSESNLLRNPGFEESPTEIAPWVATDATAWQVVSDIKHSGARSVHLPGRANARDAIYQGVTIPASALAVEAGYWYSWRSTETKAEADLVCVAFLEEDASDPSWLRCIDVAGTGSQAWAQARHTISGSELEALKGRELSMILAVVNDAESFTTVWLDDASLLVTE